MPVYPDEGPDLTLAWHYGSPVAEARLLASGDGVVDLRTREIIEISGEDRLSWLHSLTSQHLSDLKPGQSAVALILSPTGHIEHVLHGVDDGSSLMAWTEPGRAEALLAFLERMRFALRIELHRRPDLQLAWMGEAVSRDANWRARTSELGGSEVFVPRAEMPEACVGMWAFEAARIAAGIPRIFIDTDFKTIPNEIGLFGTHLDKGCYRGQETVARVHTLGRPPRRLVLLHLDGSADALPRLGASLMLEGKKVGFVGSSSRHHELGPIAMGLVKRAVPVEATLSADGISATQEVLVDPEVGLHIRPKL